MQSVRVYLAPALLAAGLMFVPHPADAASVDNGKTAFVAHGCWQCHGFEGQGSVTTSGGRVIADSQLPADAFAAYVRQPSGAMPPFSAAILSDADLADIYAYVSGLPGPAKAEDVKILH